MSEPLSYTLPTTETIIRIDGRISLGLFLAHPRG